MSEINKFHYDSAADPLGNFMVYIDGVPQIQAPETASTRQALQYLGTEALRGLGHASAIVGRSVLNGLDELVRSANAQSR